MRGIRIFSSDAGIGVGCGDSCGDQVISVLLSLLLLRSLVLLQLAVVRQRVGSL